MAPPGLMMAAESPPEPPHATKQHASSTDINRRVSGTDHSITKKVVNVIARAGVCQSDRQHQVHCSHRLEVIRLDAAAYTSADHKSALAPAKRLTGGFDGAFSFEAHGFI